MFAWLMGESGTVCGMMGNCNVVYLGTNSLIRRADMEMAIVMRKKIALKILNQEDGDSGHSERERFICNREGNYRCHIARNYNLIGFVSLFRRTR
ncbi:hypothetical protein ScPMuIL_014865 [Solemya velum]